MKTLIYTVLGVIGYSIFFNVPKKSIAPLAFISAFSYGVYLFVGSVLNKEYLALILAIMVLGLWAGYFARKLKLPTTVFFMAGIIPYVPGESLYMTMYNFVFKNYDQALSYFVNAAIVAGILSIGIYLTSALSDVLKLGYKTFIERRKDD